MDHQDSHPPQPLEDRPDPSTTPSGPHNAIPDHSRGRPCPPTEARLDANVLQHVLRGRRFKLSGDRCGYATESHVFPCFVGHDRFHDEAMWEANYAGPRVGTSWSDVRYAERLIRTAGGKAHLRYAIALVEQVEPEFEDLYTDDEVYGFWYRLATARPRDRRDAMARLARRMPRAWAGSDTRLRATPQPESFVYNARQGELLLRAVELTSRAVTRAPNGGWGADGPDDPWDLSDHDTSAHRGGERQESLGSYVRVLTPLERRWLAAMTVYGMGKTTSVRAFLAEQWAFAASRVDLMGLLLVLTSAQHRRALERAKEMLDADPSAAIGGV